MPFDAVPPLTRRQLKLDLAESPRPQGETPEGFRDYVGYASIFDTVLLYPLEAPAERQFRPRSAIDDAALASILHKPIVNSHPRVNGEKVWVLPGNAAQFAKGVVTGAELVDDKLKISFRIFDAQLMKDIDAGKVDLSPGYDCQTIPRRGVSPAGEEYDAVQEGPITFNHVAVEYRGRNPGARITTDGQDDIPMDEILALIKGGTLTPDQLKQLQTALATAAPTGGEAAPPVNAAGADVMKQIDAINTRLTALEGASKKTDSADHIDEKAIAERVSAVVTKRVAQNLSTLAAARELATPVLGRVKADAADDPTALHRDVVAAVFPEQAEAAKGYFEAGDAKTLEALARTARAAFNKQRTTDAADDIEAARKTPINAQDAEQKLREAM